jgi:hypothetical protein
MKYKIPTNRNFGITFFIFFSLLTLYSFILKDNLNTILIIVSLIFLILGLLNSNLLTPLNKIWMRFGIVLGKIVTPIVLFFIYFGVVTPTGILVKLFKKDILNIKINKKNKSYWLNKDKNKSNMNNQF